MKRDFLRELGLEDEAINKIMAEHGKGIEARKTEIETLQGQLDQSKQNKANSENKDTEIAKMRERIEELEKGNLGNTIKLEMSKAGLSEDLYDLVHDEDISKAQAKIAKLAELQGNKNINNAYKPEGKREDDAYAKAEKDGNVQGMIKNKLGRLFQ